MINYFIDNTIGDDTGNDGMSALSPFSDIFNKVEDNDNEKIVWVRRGTYEISSSLSFPSGANTKVVSWPRPMDQYYGSRPQEGIDAGWDDDTTTMTNIDLISSSAIIYPSQVIVHGIKFNGYDIKNTYNPMFSFFNTVMTLEWCEIDCAYLFYLDSYGSKDLRNISFKHCIIYSFVRMYSFPYYRNREVRLPLCENCSLYFSGRHDYAILYLKTEYYTDRLYITFNDCDIYIDVDIVRLFYTHANSGTNFNGGITSSIFNVRLHTEATLSYIFHECIGIQGSDINIDFVDSPNSVSYIIHLQSTSCYIHTSTITIKNGTFLRIFYDNYYAYQCFIHIKNCNLNSSIFSSSQRELFDVSILFESTKIPIVHAPAQTLVLDCKIDGAEDYLIKGYGGACYVLNTSFQNSCPTVSALNCGYGGSIEIANSKISSSKLIVNSHTNEKIFYVNNVDKTLIKRMGSVLYTISELERKESESNRSLVIRGVADGEKTGIINIGNGLTSIIECSIDNTTNSVTMYALVSSIDYMNEKIHFIPRYEMDILATYTIQEDTSEWSNIGPKNLVPVKIVFDVSASRQTRFSVSMFPIMKSGDILFVDSVLKKL